jgi:hypothetical protein
MRERNYCRMEIIRNVEEKTLQVTNVGEVSVSQREDGATVIVIKEVKEDKK